MSIPRPEYPRPQWVRPQWLCLNGAWQFEIDRGDSGLERGLLNRPLNSHIIVPFCPESELSEVGCTDFMNAVWYKKHVEIPAEWGDKQVLLHFGAIDYDATIWIGTPDGTWHEVTRHRGGFSSFSVNLERLAKGGETITICVRARDFRELPQPRGKQSQRFNNYGCLYTRTTGIWQTVWLEPVPRSHLRRPRITPYVGRGLFRIEQPIRGEVAGLRVRATLRIKDMVIEQVNVPADADLTPTIDITVPGIYRKQWSPREPFLYDLDLELLDADGNVIDKAESYAGMRGVTIDGQAVKINGEVIFQRLVLDQGYYPDGIMTAPTDQALIDDIKMAQDAGFNGARLHQKVFEERFLYHADKMGYLCWSEFPDWGLRGYGMEEILIKPAITCASQWLESVKRDYNHPCIIGWCGLNETYEELRDEISLLDDATHAMFYAAKAFDTTRPVLDASGYSHRVPVTDVYDCHDYEQDPEVFRQNHAGLAEGKPFYNGPKDRPWSIHYRGQPFWVSEFGGIRWNPETDESGESWGYGSQTGHGQGTPESEEEFLARFKGLIDVLLDNPHMFGYCYTQLTDVYQEQNGLYFFDRRHKFDPNRLKAIQERPAAIEMKHGK